MFEVLYFGAFVKSSRKDSFVTKICVLALTGLILVALISAYNFVCKPEARRNKEVFIIYEIYPFIKSKLLLINPDYYKGFR